MQARRAISSQAQRTDLLSSFDDIPEMLISFFIREYLRRVAICYAPFLYHRKLLSYMINLYSNILLITTKVLTGREYGKLH